MLSQLISHCIYCLNTRGRVARVDRAYRQPANMLPDTFCCCWLSSAEVNDILAWLNREWFGFIGFAWLIVFLSSAISVPILSNIYINLIHHNTGSTIETISWKHLHIKHKQETVHRKQKLLSDIRDWLEDNSPRIHLYHEVDSSCWGGSFIYGCFVFYC